MRDPTRLLNGKQQVAKRLASGLRGESGVRSDARTKPEGRIVTRGRALTLEVVRQLVTSGSGTGARA